MAKTLYEKLFDAHVVYEAENETYSLDADDAACAIERAINRALEEGIRTGDLARGAAAVSTDEMGDIIARYVAEGV